MFERNHRYNIGSILASECILWIDTYWSNYYTIDGSGIAHRQWVCHAWRLFEIRWDDKCENVFFSMRRWCHAVDCKTSWWTKGRDLHATCSLRVPWKWIQDLFVVRNVLLVRHVMLTICIADFELKTKWSSKLLRAEPLFVFFCYACEMDNERRW